MNSLNLTPSQIAAIIYLFFNIGTFLIFSYDKAVSKFNNVRFRIPEKTLLLIGICFGALGEMISMVSLRHKTLHKEFKIGLPVLTAMQLFIMGFLIFRVL